MKDSAGKKSPREEVKINKCRELAMNDLGYLDLPYFAYGSNLNLKQIKRRCPKIKPLKAVLLKNYRLTFRNDRRSRGVADIVPSQGDKVQGALYELTPQCLRALDSYEGWPRLYDRCLVQVEDAQGSIIEAFAYRMGPEYVGAPPADDYFKIIEAGFRHWGLDAAPLYKARAAVLK